MKKILLTFLFLTVANLASAGQLEVKLQAFKVTHDDTGKEQLVSADEAEPGEVIEYQATYTNTSNIPLEQVAPEVPVPSGLTLITGSIHPVPSEGSRDGKTFAPLPLHDAEGHPVPAAEIRSIRWFIATLAPASTFTVSLRATVNR